MKPTNGGGKIEGLRETTYPRLVIRRPTLCDPWHPIYSRVVAAALASQRRSMYSERRAAHPQRNSESHFRLCLLSDEYQQGQRHAAFLG